ncbi:phosphatase PAP2 family protein [Vannielia litorea]|nr:phosphatase PAP2 family protein [Vannielia litorea]
MSGSILTTRDGIVGPYEALGAPPTQMPANDVNTLAEWGTTERLNMILGEVVGSIGVTGSGEACAAYHLETTGGDADTAPGTDYKRLVKLTRPSPDDFLAQTAIVHNYADLRVDRAAEIFNQVGYAMTFFQPVLGLRAGLHKYTLELIGVVQAATISTEMQFKQRLACLRPDRYSAQLMPLIPTPGHGALPSGHATESHCVARLLVHLMRGKAALPRQSELLMATAARITTNRTVAGVHFPADNFAGATLGFTLADYLAQRAGAAGATVAEAEFNGVGIGDEDYHLSKVYDLAADAPKAHGTLVTRGTDVAGVSAAPMLSWLWSKAREEWADA